MKLLVKVSDFTLSLLVIQYALLVLNLNQLTSPITIPSAISNASLLKFITGNTELVITPYLRLLGFGTTIGDTRGLIVDNLAILLLQIYLWLFIGNIDSLLKQFVRTYKESADLAEELQRESNIKNYNSWKDPDHSYMKRSMQFVLINLQNIMITILSFISLLHISLPNFIITAIFLFYTLLVEFTLVKAQIRMKTQFMMILFKWSQLAILAIVILVIVNGLPFGIFPVFSLSPVIYDKIIIFTILQMLYDIIVSDDYEVTLQKYLLKNSTKARLVSLCTTYRFNDRKLLKIVDDYITKQELNHKLQRVSDRLRVWHEQFFEDKGKKEMRSHSELQSENREEKVQEENVILSPRKEAKSPEISPTRTSLKKEDLKEKTLQRLKSNFETKNSTQKEVSVSFFSRIKIAVVRALLNWRNPYLFESIQRLYKEVSSKNKVIIPEQMTSLNDYTIKYDFSRITMALDQID